MRTQPPVLSPLSPHALLSTVVASARGRGALHQFRELLLREYHADGVLLTGSGTDALQLAIKAATERTAERTVALPAFSCFDVATAAIGARARIVLYDLDPDTLAPEPASLEHAFRRGARAAVVAPLYGVPVDWDAVAELAARHDALLIEDAAQGHGARWRDQALGSIGALSLLSFGRGKGWTGGGGGALLWRGSGAPTIGDQLVPQSPVAGGTIFGKAAAQWALGRPSLYGIPAALPWLSLGETVYHEPRAPRAMARVEAALLLATRADAAREAAARRVTGEWWREQTGRGMAVPEGGASGHLRFPLRLEAAAAAATVRALGKLGVAASYPSTLAQLPAVRTVLAEHSDWPGADTLVRELITLPTHSLLTRAEREHISAWLRS